MDHGFILAHKGWVLSPAYDLNPSVEKDGLALNIDMDDNALDFDLARSIGKFCRLDQDGMESILHQVLTVVKDWKSIAKKIGIANREIEIMTSAYRYK